MYSLRALFLALVCVLNWHVVDAAPSAESATSLATATAAPRSRAEIRQQLVDVAMSQVGVREALVAGKYRNSGRDVEKYLKGIGLGKGYAWCAAFVVWCIREAGLKVPSYGMAHSFFTPRTKKWPNVPGAEAPQPGDPHGYRFVRSDVDHVGLVKFWGVAPMADVIEGNTGSRASREGQGVYRKWVLKSQIAEVADLFKCIK